MIRAATIDDRKAIRSLLEQIGYRIGPELLKIQMRALLEHQDQQLLVYELEKTVVAFVALHFLTQMAFDGELVIITYLVVDEGFRNKGIGKQLEEYVVFFAKKRKCDRIQLHCREWQTDVHKFYQKQGYKEYPKYYTKRLIYAE